MCKPFKKNQSMKPWMWWAIGGIVVVVIIYAIYSANKRAEQERLLQQQQLAAQTGEEPESNIFSIISQISALLASAGIGNKKDDEPEPEAEEEAAKG